MKRTVPLCLYSIVALSGCSSDEFRIDELAPVAPMEMVQSRTVTLEAEASDEFFVFTPENTFDESELFYARSQDLNFDDNGALVNSRGLIPVTFLTNPDGSAVSTAFPVSERLLLNVQSGLPQPTRNAIVSVDLSPQFVASNNDVVDEDFDQCSPDLNLFNASTSVTVFDSFGQDRVMTLFFIKTDQESNAWAVRVTVDCQLLEPVFGDSNLDFNTAGELDIGDADNDGFLTSDNGAIEYRFFAFDDGSIFEDVTINFASGEGGSTRSTADNFTVFNLEQDGFFTDSFESLIIDSRGIVTVTLADVDEQILGKLALARFDNPESLIDVGDGLFQATETSGAAEFGEALERGFNGVAQQQVDL
jgi:flagellar hook protein FlgE